MVKIIQLRATRSPTLGSYTKVDDRTLDLTVKKDGKIIDTVRMVLSADGKSRTVTVTGTTPKGKKFTNVVVYDKQ
jgi:hypothetical protein